MNDKRNERWRELSWRHSLPPAERERRRAWLADHPESRAEWEVEAGLTEALDRLPNVPVSSNFTSLVMRQIEREGLRQGAPCGCHLVRLVAPAALAAEDSVLPPSWSGPVQSLPPSGFGRSASRRGPKRRDRLGRGFLAQPEVSQGL